jgi:ABC-type transport system involved in multi-copper enzyme maturation permease subunit
MANLIKIEMRKISIKQHLLYLAGANVAFMVILGVLNIVFPNAAEQVPAVTQVSILNLVVFAIWQSALIAKLVVGEFSNKTIQLMFTYPISRKGLILSKLVLINTMIFLSLLSTQIVQHMFLMGLSHLDTPIVHSLAIADTATIALVSFATVMLGMLSLFVGMIKYSPIATVATSIAIIAALGSSVGEGMGNFVMHLPLSLSLGAIGCVLSYLSIRNIDKKDLLV